MKSTYKILLGVMLFFASPIFSQEYVKYITKPPTEIAQKTSFINNIDVKYNIPTSGYLYLTLFKDNKPVGNCVKKVTRGKRMVKCDIFIWDGGKSITKKGKYFYKLEIYKGSQNDFSNKLTNAPIIYNIKVVKRK